METVTTSVVNQPSRPVANNPFDKTILLSITVKTLGVTRKVSTESVEVDADKDMLRVSKKILDCKEYKNVQAAVGELKKFLRARSVPGVRFVKGGIYPIPSRCVEEIDRRVGEDISTYNACVAKFLEVYEARAEEGKERLRVLGDSADYPSLDKVKAAFGIATEYITLGPPESLKSISADLWRRESDKIKATCEAASSQVRDAMRAMFADLVNHMTERLDVAADGKPKVFKSTLVSNFKEFIDNFADRNITGDNELSALVDQARNILANKPAETLRKDQDLRSMVKDRMTEIKAKLDTMIGDKPTRALTVED